MTARGTPSPDPAPVPDASARAGWLIVVLVALSTCIGERTFSSSAHAPPLPAPVPSASALPSPAASATLAEAPDADAGVAPAPRAAPVELGEPVVDVRVFREILVGALPPTERRTWVLSRGATRAKVAISCQGAKKPAVSKGKLWMSLDGQENDPSRWLPADVVQYVGPQTSKLSYRLAAASKPAGACQGLPDVILLSCRSALVDVLRAGAALVVGQRGPNDDMPPSHWQPAQAQTVPSLRCATAFESEPHALGITLWHDVDVVFAPGKRGSPGVELAFENSDSVVQRGAYRWMPVDDDPAAFP